MTAPARQQHPPSATLVILRRTARRLYRPSVPLVGMGISLAVIQLVSFDLGRYLTFDEAVYLSEVYPATDPILFTAPRARGLPWLVSPVALLSPPIWAIRLYLLVVSSTLFVVAFRAWLPVIGAARTIVASAVFGTGWMALYYGSELFPNLLVAYGAIFAAAYFARHLLAGDQASWRSPPLWTAAAALATIAVVRPTEASMIAVGFGASAIPVMRHVRQVPRLLVVWGVTTAGVLVGWLPWVIEAFARFGGLLARLDAASANVGGGFHPGNLRSHLALVDGPLRDQVGDPTPVLGPLLWAFLVGGVIAALGRSLISANHTAVVPAVAGVATASQYLLLTEVVQARFLLPAYGLLVLGAVAAAPKLRLPAIRRVVAVVCVLALAVWLPFNLDVADSLESEQDRRRQVSLQLADVVRRHAGDPPCAFASQYAFPEIAFASGCHGTRVTISDPLITFREPPGRAPVYVLSITHPDELAVPAVPGTIVSLQGEGAPGWWLFVAAPGTLRITP